MQQLVYFIKKFRYFLLFVLLEVIALLFTIQQQAYHQSKFINSANALSGGLYKKLNNFQEFINLKSENKLLIEENIQLKNYIDKQNFKSPITTHQVTDSTVFHQKYEFLYAKIINNNFARQNNYLTIDKGLKQGVLSDLGVVNSKGVIGVIKNVSGNYATVLSILNSTSKINVRLKNSHHFGTLVWNGKNPNIVQIIDIPRQAVIKVGDSIITGGKSAIFPEGIPVGTITNFKFEKNKYREINVSLFNDMTALGYAQVIKNLHKTEIRNLELSIDYE